MHGAGSYSISYYALLCCDCLCRRQIEEGIGSSGGARLCLTRLRAWPRHTDRHFSFSRFFIFCIVCVCARPRGRVCFTLSLFQFALIHSHESTYLYPHFHSSFDAWSHYNQLFSVSLILVFPWHFRYNRPNTLLLALPLPHELTAISDSTLPASQCCSEIKSSGTWGLVSFGELWWTSVNVTILTNQRSFKL